MSTLLRGAVVLLAVLAARLIFYQSRLWQIKRLRKRYWEFLRDPKEDGAWLAGQYATLKQMMKECDVPAAPFPATRPGYAPQIAFAHDNLTFRSSEIADLNDDTMLRIQGHYSNERNKTLSPVYWLEVVAFLPREVLRYLGIGSDKLVVRASDVAWWVLLVWQAVAWALGKATPIDLVRTLAR